MQVMRRELVMPLQFSGFGIERQHGRRIEVIAFALVPVVIRTGIAGGPVNQSALRIVRAREPGGATAVLGSAAVPRFGSRFARRGNRPETPRALAGGSFVGIQKSPDSFIAARDSGNH